MWGSNRNKPKGEEKWIQFKIVGQDENEAHFKVNMITEFGTFKRSYAEKLGVAYNSLLFIFKGRRINDDDTPEKLALKEEDGIEVYQKLGGGKAQIIQRLLECVVCLEPCASPIYNCLDNGHLVCGFCLEKLRKTAAICPLCKCKNLQPSSLGERQSRQNDMEGNCPFSGCSETILAAGLMPHVRNCEYRDIQCTSARVGNSASARPCNKMFSLGKYPLHAINVHKTRSLTQGDLDSDLFVAFLLPVPFRAGDKNSENYWRQPPKDFGQSLCEYDGNYFTVNAAIRNQIFYWWVTIFGGQKEADRYQYETELWENNENMDEQKSSKNAAGVQIVPVLPFNQYVHFDKSCGNYAMVHAATAWAYSAKRTDFSQMRKLTLRIKISRIKSRTRAEETGNESVSKWLWLLIIIVIALIAYKYYTTY